MNAALMLLLMRMGASAVVSTVPSVPGAEYKWTDDRLHYKHDGERLHYSVVEEGK